MTQDDFEAFSEVVVGFAELKGKQLSPAAIKLYWNAMRHWELADFRAAAEELLRRSEFMPTPKDFEDLRKAGRPTSAEAWITVRHCARNGLPIPVRDYALEGAVAALGGIRAISMTNTDQMPFLERRFADHYEQLQDATDVRAAVPQIASSSAPRLNGPKPIGVLLPPATDRSA